MLQYFGTNTRDYGHYIWKCGEYSLTDRSLNLSDYPFDFYQVHKDKWVPKGTVLYFQIGGYSVLQIEGSCKDQRGGTVSVFFAKEDLTEEQLMDRIRLTPSAYEIIKAMPFEIKWNLVVTQ